MTDEQFQNFIYSCKNIALQFHFLESEAMGSLLTLYEKNENNNSFFSVVLKNYRVVHDYHVGVCFSLSCYLKEITQEMGLEDVYLMESFDSYWPNTVLLYKYGNDWLVCDLAKQIRAYEEFLAGLSSYMSLINVTDKDKELLYESIESTKKDNYLSQTLEEYFKEYYKDSCEIVNHKGNENLDFFDVPRLSVDEFLKGMSYPKM